MQAVGQAGLVLGFVRFKSASHVSTFPLFQKLPEALMVITEGGVLAARLLDISNSNLDTRFTVAALLRVGCMAISKMEKHIVPPAMRGAASSWLQGTSDSKRQSCCSVIIKWRFNEERTDRHS